MTKKILINRIFLFLIVIFGYCHPHIAAFNPRWPPYPPPGSIIINTTALKNGEILNITIKSPNRPPITQALSPVNGRIQWQAALPPGQYEIFYTLPPSYQPLPPQKIFLQSREQAILTPKPISNPIPNPTTKPPPKEETPSLRIESNTTEAIFILRQTKTSQVWKGEGKEFNFSGLDSGTYSLSFSSSNPNHFIPPREMHFYLNENDKKQIKVTFQIAGKITINTNIAGAHATIQEMGGSHQVYQEDILDKSKAVTLPEGRYRISLTPPPNNAQDLPTETAEINLQPLTSQVVDLPFKLEGIPEKQKQIKINVNSNTPSAGFTLSTFSGPIEVVAGHYTGKNIQLTPPPADKYKITFDPLPNFETPPPEIFQLNNEQEKIIQANYIPLIETAPVPAGKAIIGDATSDEKINELPAKIVHVDSFSIGVYEITNAQYATWLNQALKEGNITYVKEADSQGQVLDLEGHLLFKTYIADNLSQISAQMQSLQEPTFIPLPGRDLYPVINVSWYGAFAYCRDNKCRLPTEAEWEKAAGMAIHKKGEPLKKFIYGFGKNTIDRTWANYKDNDQVLKYFRVLTTPVGFYNGQNVLPLTASHNKQERTHLAQSPHGAFDMSGNVWEWVADWFDDAYYKNMSDNNPKGPSSGTLKVVKGGCYDSLAEGVRVSERLGLLPDYADAYTGFRIVR